MKIAKIVSSNSHIDYIARVVDSLDVANPPTSGDYGFGHFVGVEVEDADVVGVIYDSQIINPEYANYGPRLSPKPALGEFSPDFLNEQGVLLGILLLGTLNDKNGSQGIPQRIVPPGQDVRTLSAVEVKRFHANVSGSVSIHYYAQLIANAGKLAVPLINSILDTLAADCDEAGRQRLGVLRRSIAWHSTLGGMKL